MITLIALVVTATYLLLDKYLPSLRSWRMPQVGARFRTDP